MWQNKQIYIKETCSVQSTYLEVKFVKVYITKLWNVLKLT